MSDEIEIEEHDLLDDPTVRNIFPDIARLKQEILDYENNEDHQDPPDSTSNSRLDNINEIENDSNDSVNKLETSVNQTEDFRNFQNNVQHNEFVRGDKGIKVQVHNNKIILGTRPASSIESKSDYFEKHVKPYCAVIVLEDFGLYLNNSSRYCNKCLIFFPTHADYNIHKRKFHIGTVNDCEDIKKENESELQNQEIQKVKAVVERKYENPLIQKKTDKPMVKIESKNVNICLICNKVYLRKDYLKSHMITIHKISKEKIAAILPDGRGVDARRERNECFHCKQSFRTQNLLIEHIYNILQTPSNQSDNFSNKIVIGNKSIEDSPLKNVNKFGNKMKSFEDSNSKNNIKIIKENKNVVGKSSNVFDEAQNVLKVLRCNFCLLYFRTFKFFVRHMSVKHKMVKNLQTTKVAFDPKCKHCSRTCDSVEKYNGHLHKSHRETLIAAITESRKSLINTVKRSNVSENLKQIHFRCDICFLYFSNMTYYSQHMINKHHKTVKSPNTKMVKLNPKCPYCPKMTYTLRSFNKHLYGNHPDKLDFEVSSQKSSSTRDGSAVSDDDTVNTECYTCNYCCLYFKSKRYFIRHMAIKHKMVKISNWKKLKFNPKCKFCPKLLKSVKMYNNHISKCHSQRSKQVNKKNTNLKVINDNEEHSSKDSNNQNGIECYRCPFCPSYFMTMKYYIRHLKVRHKIANRPKPKKVLFNSKCKYCPAKFNEIKFYNKHLYQNHYEKVNEVTEKVKQTHLGNTQNRGKEDIDETKISSVKTFYRCCYCSYYFKTLNIYNRHIMKKHKVQRVHEVKKIPFDPKCKYCSRVTSDDATYNKHLSSCHWNRIIEVFKESSKDKLLRKSHGKVKEEDNITLSSAIKRNKSNSLKLSQSDSMPLKSEKKISTVSNIVVPISKSALFKCHKCDIHFLTIQSALDHSNHMEMLINWKCALCHRIFKDNDRWLHEKQHLFSHVFTVYGIDQPNISQILYKCSKCAMHFDESVVDSHHYECALNVPQSYMCKICDILVDNKAQICHEYNHKHRHFTSNDFIIIETASVYKDTNKYNLNSKDKSNLKTVDDIQTTTENSQVKRLNSSDIKIPRKTLKRKIDDVKNIQVIKSKKTKKDQKADNPQNKLKGSDDNITYSMEVSLNQQRHDKYALKLSFCNTCQSFVSMIGQKRKAHVQKRCAHMTSVVCKDCGLKLSAKTLSTHRQMHLRIKNLQLHHFKFYDFKTGKRVYPPLPEYEKCEICEVNFISKSTLGRHVCSESEYKVCEICKIKLFKPIFHLHVAFHKYRNLESASAPSANKVLSNKSIKESKNSFMLLYCCKVCYVYVDSYDHLIEHCQKHCLNNLSTNTEECEICKLPFEENCLKRHAKVHESVDVSLFEKLFFDPFYFRFDHTIWLNHVFGSHSHLKIEDILLKSVYRHEHRFKMEVAQEGSPDLTLYKCVKCNRHVEADIIYQHVKNACSNLRKYPCSICHLDFISSFSLQRHKTIHKDSLSKDPPYRIIHFNRQEDDELTKVIFGPPKLYVLYQCRHCNVVVGSSQRASHKCNKKTFTSCSDCGLQIYKDIYELHCSMHKTLDSFISENIKVVLFGQYQSKNERYVAMESSFRGKIHDYSFYKCSKCNVCVKNKSQTVNHNCDCKGQPRVACSICGLYFYADKLISHINNHETDPDLILDNMTFIEFQPEDDQLENKKSKIANFPDISIDLDSNIESENAGVTPVIEFDCKNDQQNTKETPVIDFDINHVVILNNAKNAAEHPLEAKNMAVSYQCVEDSKICPENATETLASLESTNDAAVPPENANNTPLNAESADDTMINLKNANDTALSLESADSIAVSSENGKDTAVSLQNVRDSAVSLEIVKDTANHLVSAEDTAVHSDKAKAIAVSLENTKENIVTLEKSEDTIGLQDKLNTPVTLINPNDTEVNLKNAHDTAINKENTKDIALNRPQENNLPGKNEIEELEKRADIYHCRCGLHFLDEKSITEHFSHCGSKSKQAKQNCSKCGLLFTPNVLFKHLLTHHGDKDHKFKINIIEKCNEQLTNSQ